ncbi:MAG: hypothetical protein K2M17_01490, partial [Bacilli bacterium]|nr:hypothetical protein [Bacilli bacterium]
MNSIITKSKYFVKSYQYLDSVPKEKICKTKPHKQIKKIKDINIKINKLTNIKYKQKRIDIDYPP